MAGAAAPRSAWTQHLTDKPKGTFVTQDDAFAHPDYLFSLCKAQLEQDRYLSDNWTNRLTESSAVYFKPDINPFNPLKRLAHATRVSLNMGADYLYTKKIYPGRVLQDTTLGRYIERYVFPEVAQWAQDTWPHDDVAAPGPPNNVLINYYEDDKGYIGAHADKTEVNQNPATDPVVMLSLGATRNWKVKPKKSGGQTVTVQVKHGQAAIMHEPMQQNYLHEVPPGSTLRAKEPNIIQSYGGSTERFSLTFRWLAPLDTEERRAEMQKLLKGKVKRLANLPFPSDDVAATLTRKSTSVEASKEEAEGQLIRAALELQDGDHEAAAKMLHLASLS